MTLVLYSLVFSFYIFADSNVCKSNELYNEEAIEELSSTLLGDYGNLFSFFSDKVSDYKVEKACAEEVDSKSVTAKIYKCKDGSISYKQPKSTGLGGYNGYCGETAVANVVYMNCNRITSPTGYCNKYTSDSTPGTRPDSMESGLNTIYTKNRYHDDNKRFACPRGKWTWYEGATSPEFYISSLSKGLKAQDQEGFERKRSDGSKVQRSPFPILIKTPSSKKGLHWVTVVDVIGFEGQNKKLITQDKCFSIINHWNKQYKVPCHRLAKWASETDAGIAGLTTGKYARVKFEPSSFPYFFD